MRIGRDAYWKAIAQAVNRLPRGPSEQQMAREAERIANTYDALDIIKWTHGLPGASPPPFDVDDILGSLRWLAQLAATGDIEDYDRIGHVPEGAPPNTYELKHDDYWEGVARFLALARRNAEDDSDASLFDALDVTVTGHPFTSFPRSLDVVRLSQNLAPALTDKTWASKVRAAQTRWRALQGNEKRFAFELLAQIAMIEDAYRMATSQGMFVPNASETFVARGSARGVFIKSPPQASIPAAIHWADQQVPRHINVIVRGEYTSDGTHWAEHGGRVVAVRERGTWTTG